jgi:hypothetical protein
MRLEAGADPGQFAVTLQIVFRQVVGDDQGAARIHGQAHRSTARIAFAVQETGNEIDRIPAGRPSCNGTKITL